MKNIKTIIFILIAVGVVVSMPGCGKKKKHKITAATLKIVTEPAGAKLIVNAKDCGKTPYSKEINAKLYLIKLDKEGFQPSWIMPDLKPGKTTEVNVKLKPVTSAVLIKSDPSGAKVKVGEVVKGETPLVLIDQPLGSHSAVVEKLGFSPREITWKITDDRPVEVNIRLSSNVGKAVITSQPSRAVLYIDGKQCGYTPYRGDLEEGRHKIKIHKDGYTDISDVITVEREKTVSKDLVMRLLPGTLVINTAPTRAEVYINGKAYGSSPVTANGLEPGRYRVRAARGGYDSNEKSVTVAPGKTLVVDLTLTRNTGGIDLLVQPPGATLYINGRKVGSVKADKDGLSELFQMRGLQAGNYRLKIAHKRAVPTQKEFTVKVTKGRISRPKPVRLWIANAEIKEVEGKVMTGIIYERNSKSILFSPEPGVKYEINRTKLEYIKDLKQDEE